MRQSFKHGMNHTTSMISVWCIINYSSTHYIKFIMRTIHLQLHIKLYVVHHYVYIQVIYGYLKLYNDI